MQAIRHWSGAAVLALSTAAGSAAPLELKDALGYSVPKTGLQRQLSNWQVSLFEGEKCPAPGLVVVPKALRAHIHSAARSCVQSGEQGNRMLEWSLRIRPRALSWHGFSVRSIQERRTDLIDEGIVLSSSTEMVVTAKAEHLFPRVLAHWQPQQMGSVREPEADQLVRELEAAVEQVTCRRSKSCRYEFGHSY